MEIREVDYAIANNFGDYIEINKHLKPEYPKLYRAILKHELSHTNEKGFTGKDFALDLTDDSINYKELLVFIIRHPKALYQLLPIFRKNKVWIYDINLMIVWSVIFIAITLAIFLSL